MSRGWRPKPSEAERLDAIKAETVKIIKKAMIDRDIDTVAGLAELIDMTPDALYRRFRELNWSQSDLCRIISALKIDAGSALAMLGVRTR